MSAKLAFKSDRFKKNRGGYSRWLLLSCEKCKNPILFYQKDGPGILKRLYIDRIVDGKNFVDKNLVCKECKTVLGIKIVYQKENRQAYRLFAGAIEKKVIKGDELPKINF
jgi:hypothetical protein